MRFNIKHNSPLADTLSLRISLSICNLRHLAYYISIQTLSLALYLLPCRPSLCPPLSITRRVFYLRHSLCLPLLYIHLVLPTIRISLLYISTHQIIGIYLPVATNLSFSSLIAYLLMTNLYPCISSRCLSPLSLSLSLHRYLPSSLVAYLCRSPISPISPKNLPIGCY